MDVPVSVTGESVGVDKGGKLQILRHNLTLKGKPHQKLLILIQKRIRKKYSDSQIG